MDPWILCTTVGFGLAFGTAPCTSKRLRGRRGLRQVVTVTLGKNQAPSQPGGSLVVMPMQRIRRVRGTQRTRPGCGPSWEVGWTKFGDGRACSYPSFPKRDWPAQIERERERERENEREKERERERARDREITLSSLFSPMFSQH